MHARAHTLELWSLLAGGGGLGIDTGVDLQALLDKHGAEVVKHTHDFLRVMEEASRLEEEHYKAQGWLKKDGKWLAPDTRERFDGPGSPVSIRGLFINSISSSGSKERSGRPGGIFPTAC